MEQFVLNVMSDQKQTQSLRNKTQVVTLTIPTWSYSGTVKNKKWYSIQKNGEYHWIAFHRIVFGEIMSHINCFMLASILSVYLRSLFLLLLHQYSTTPPTPHEQMTSQLQQLYLSHLTTLLDYTNLSRKTPRYGDKTHSSQQNKLKRCNLFSISKNYVWHLKCCIALTMLWKISIFAHPLFPLNPSRAQTEQNKVSSPVVASSQRPRLAVKTRKYLYLKIAKEV